MELEENQLKYLRSLREFLRECQDLRDALDETKPRGDPLTLRLGTRALVQEYFDDLEPELAKRKMQTDDLHECMERLLRISGSPNSKKIGLSNIERAMSCLKDLELKRIIS